MNEAALSDFYRELEMLHYLPRHAHIVALLGYVVDKPSREYLMVLGQCGDQKSKGAPVRRHTKSPGLYDLTKGQ